jgi:hypothetical protein
LNERDTAEPDIHLKSVRAVRLGHGANCSSIGSVVDTLFATAVIGSAVLVAVLAAMKREPITVVSPPSPDPQKLAERSADRSEPLP